MESQVSEGLISTLNIVMVLLSIVSLIGWVLMLIAGFKRSVWWGLGIFFLLPIVGLIFAIKYWPEARLGCLLQLVPTVIAIGLAIVFASAFTAMFAGSMVQELNREGLTGEQGAPRALGQPGGSDDAGQGTQPEQKAQTPPAPPRTVRYAYQDTDFDYLPGRVGSQVRILTMDGREHEGTVVSARDDSVLLRKRVGNGSMEFRVPKRDAKTVQIYEALQ